MSFTKILSLLSPADFVTISFLLCLTVLNVVFAERVPQWGELVAGDILVIGIIVTLAYLAEKKKTRLFVGLHRWYVYPAVFFIFKETYLMVHPIHPADYDGVLIAIDYRLFGVNPTQWLAQFSHPLVTEILQIAYWSYYLLFLTLGWELYRRFTIEKFDSAAFTIVYGFYLSYIGYFLLPAVGPRFTLHDFYSLNQDLPGIFLTNALRDFVNAGESIPQGVTNAVDYAQRDVFPSGHTQLTLITCYLAFLNNLRSRWVLLVVGSLLIVSTVYLRYHYVVDLLAGVIFFLFTIWSGKRIEAWWQKSKMV